MHIIESRTNEHMWVVAVTEDLEHALNLYGDLPGPQTYVLHTPALSFPFFIVEDETGFSFVDRKQLDRMLIHLPADRPTDDPLMTVYVVKEPMEPNKRGDDQMAALPQTRITKKILHITPHDRCAHAINHLLYSRKMHL